MNHLVDWHSHVWLPDHLGSEWGGELDAKYRHFPSRAGSPEAHRVAMEEAGVSVSVVIALTSAHLDLHIPNEYVAEYVRSDPHRLIGVASVDPNDVDAPTKLREALDEMGHVGLKLSPPYQAFHPHAPEADVLYGLAEERGAFVIFHQGAVTQRRGVLDHAQPYLLDKVARDHPHLQIVIAHAGQPWFNEVIPLLRKHPNMFADISARCSRPWQLSNILRLAVDYDVDSKILFGSDFPTFTPKDHLRDLLALPTRPEAAGIGEETVRGIAFDRQPSLLTNAPAGQSLPQGRQHRTRPSDASVQGRGEKPS